MARFLFILLFPLCLLGQTRAVINTGTNPNDGTGDSLRTFGLKSNTNFSTLWSSVYTNGVTKIGTNVILAGPTVFDGNLTNGFELGDINQLTLDGVNTGVYGVQSLFLDGGTTTLRGTTNLQIITPSVRLGTATAGQVLMLSDAVEGTVEYSSIPPHTQFYAVAGTGTNVVVAGGTLVWADGTTSSVPGRTVPTPASQTNYIMADLQDLTLHCYDYGWDEGSVLIATVVTGASSITSITQPSQFNVPPSSVSRFKAKLRTATATNVTVAMIGDSLTQGSGTGINWVPLVFSTAQSTNGYNIGNLTRVTYTNYAEGGTTSEYGMAVVGNYVSTSPQIDASALSVVQDAYHVDATFPTIPQSPISKFPPDLTIVGYNVNQGTYNGQALENIVRSLKRLGGDVILLNENSNSNALTSNSAFLVTIRDIAKAYGCGMADSYSRVNEWNRAGTNTYSDSVHQNQLGWNAYAGAIRSILNDRIQDPGPIVGVPLPPRVVKGATSYDSDRMFEVANVVTTPVATSGTVTTLTSNIGANAVPKLFNVTTTTLIQSGGYASYTFPFWSAVRIIVNRRDGGTNSFGGYLAFADSSGTARKIKDVSFTDSSGGALANLLFWGVDIADAQTIQTTDYPYKAGAVGSVRPAMLQNGSIRLYVTNGTASILGAIFYSPTWRPLQFREWERISATGADLTTNSWNIGTNLMFASQGARYQLQSATSGDQLRWSGDCIGLALSFQSSTASGRINLYADGTDVNGGVLDMYTTGGFFPWLVNTFPDNGGSLASPSRWHTFVIRANGANASADAVPVLPRIRYALQRAYVIGVP